MKKLLFILNIAIFAGLFSACTSDDSKAYADLIDDEKEAISDYISRNNIEVISQAPANGIWGANQYLLTGSGLYIHIDSIGDADTPALTTGKLIIARYNKITLNIEPDTVYRNWTPADYPYPTEFYYGTSTDVSYAFQEAVSIMKNNNSQAKLIVPSKIGSTEDINNVIPYAYDFKIKIGD